MCLMRKYCQAYLKVLVTESRGIVPLRHRHVKRKVQRLLYRYFTPYKRSHYDIIPPPTVGFVRSHSAVGAAGIAEAD